MYFTGYPCRLETCILHATTKRNPCKHVMENQCGLLVVPCLHIHVGIKLQLNCTMITRHLQIHQKPYSQTMFIVTSKFYLAISTQNTFNCGFINICHAIPLSTGVYTLHIHTTLYQEWIIKRATLHCSYASIYKPTKWI